MWVGLLLAAVVGVLLLAALRLKISFRRLDMTDTKSVTDIIAKPPTDNERSMYEWACKQSGFRLDQFAFTAGRRLQTPWQEWKRLHTPDGLIKDFDPIDFPAFPDDA